MSNSSMCTSSHVKIDMAKYLTYGSYAAVQATYPLSQPHLAQPDLKPHGFEMRCPRSLWLEMNLPLSLKWFRVALLFLALGFQHHSTIFNRQYAVRETTKQMERLQSQTQNQRPDIQGIYALTITTDGEQCQLLFSSSNGPPTSSSLPNPIHRLCSTAVQRKIQSKTILPVCYVVSSGQR
jgi:hypothetical protein